MEQSKNANCHKHFQQFRHGIILQQRDGTFLAKIHLNRFIFREILPFSTVHKIYAVSFGQCRSNLEMNHCTRYTQHGCHVTQPWSHSLITCGTSDTRSHSKLSFKSGFGSASAPFSSKDSAISWTISIPKKVSDLPYALSSGCKSYAITSQATSYFLSVLQ